MKEKIKEIKKIEKEKNDLQNHADHLQQQLKEARLELQVRESPFEKSELLIYLYILYFIYLFIFILSKAWD